MKTERSSQMLKRTKTMKIEDYKKRFINLFKEMEQDIGPCYYVEVEREEETAYGTEEIIASTYKCRVRF